MRTSRALFLYFALAFGISWSAVAFAASQDSRLLMFFGMLLGPSLASIALTARLGGTQGLRRFAQRLLREPARGRWYAAALVAPALVAVVLFSLSLASPSFLPAVLEAASPAIALAFAAFVGLGAGIFEELGWTGFATPRLLRERSWLRAGVLLGVVWAFWHVLPDFLGRAAYGRWWALHMLEWIVALTAFRAFMTWIYSRTRNLVLAMLLHASFSGGQTLLWPDASPRGEVLWYGLFACALWVVVGLVVLAQRYASLAPSSFENQRLMKGDDLLPAPMFTVTHAVTIEAPPERVWPWLSQMGASRAGWYSFDWIDNGGRPSAKRVLREYQAVRSGDVMPALPGATDAFLVADVEPPRDLILTVPGDGEPIVTWEHLVERLERGRSRLTVRGRVAKSWKPMAREAGGAHPRLIERVYRVLGRLPDAWMIAFASAGHRWMEARHMRGIKRRAERASSAA